MPVETWEERGETASPVGEIQPLRCLLLYEASASDFHQVCSLMGARSWDPLLLSDAMTCGPAHPWFPSAVFGPSPYVPDPCCTTLAIL